jgi:hypothetical protein
MCIILLLRDSTVLETTLSASDTGAFLILFRHSVGLLWTSDQPIARATQHRKTRTNIHALSGFQTHDLSVQEIKAHDLDRATSVTDHLYNQSV